MGCIPCCPTHSPVATVVWTVLRTGYERRLECGLGSGEVSRQNIIGPAKLARVTVLGALFCVLLCYNAVTLAMAPTFACATLDNELSLFVNLLTDNTLSQGVAWSAKGIVLKPLRVETRIIGAAACTHGTPENSRDDVEGDYTGLCVGGMS